MARRAGAVFAIAIWGISILPAGAQQITREGMLRTYGNLLGIQSICGRFVLLNKAKGERLLMLLQQAVSTSGPGDSDPAMLAAIARSADQARTVGGRRWCLDQRQRWRKLPGGDELFP